MRNAFAEIVEEIAEIDPHLVLLAGDIGNRLFDGFKAKYPDRFYNCGVAESSMTGLAAGLAASGLHPITYTITPFNTLRCMEQIRVDVCYPNLPVIIVGTGSGLSYSSLGATHHSLEDIAAMRVLPNMHVLAPADSIEVGLAVKDAVRLGRPTYIRIGKKGEPNVHVKEPSFEIGKGIDIKEGSGIVFLGVGTMLSIAMESARLMNSEGLSPRVISLHTVKPLDEELLNCLFNDYHTIAVVEEHGLAGGAGSAILEWGNANFLDTRKVVRFGIPDRFLMSPGTQEEARESVGLDPKFIVDKLRMMQ